MKDVIARLDRALSELDAATSDRGSWTDDARQRLEAQRLLPLAREGRRLAAALQAFDRNLTAAERSLND